MTVVLPVGHIHVEFDAGALRNRCIGGAPSTQCSALGRAVERLEGIRHTGRELRLCVSECCHVITLMRDPRNAAHEGRQRLCGITRNVPRAGHFIGCGVHRQHGGADVIPDALHRGGDTLGGLCTFDG